MAEVASASFPPAASPAVPRDRDPVAARILTAAITAALAVLVASRSDSLIETVSSEWPALLFWILVLLVVNLLPVSVEDFSLTLDLPVLLAVAILYPPEVAAVVAFVGAVDVREIAKRQIGFSRSLFNRAQIGLSIFLAGSVYWTVAGGLEPLALAAAGTAAALTVDYLANFGLVSLHLAARRRLTLRSAARKLTVGGLGQFLATYLGYGVLALVVARLFLDVGAWSVVTFLVPTLVARQMLLRGQQLQTLTQSLQYQERVLKKALERLVDERRDERSRISGELHDDVLQSLTRIQMVARWVAESARSQGVYSEDHAELVDRTEDVIVALREVIQDLRESPLRRGGLVATIRDLVADLAFEWKTRIEMNLPDDVALSRERQVIVYQVAREALTNALKHSGADQVKLLLEQAGEVLRVDIEDDGAGFTPQQVSAESHFGLDLMRERVSLLGGQLLIQSQTNEGTRVQARIPLRPARSELYE